MKSCFVFFPFDLFGGAGSRSGAELLAEAFHEMLADNRRETVPTRASAYQGRVRMRQLSFDTLADYGRWRPAARQVARQLLRRGEFLGWIAGNHLGVLPVYDELSLHWPDTLVVQLDAHLDVYNLLDCTSELSHGNFLLHVAGTLPPIVNIGSRELLLRPEQVGKHYHRVLPAELWHLDPAGARKELANLVRPFQRVFLDVDCDVFDVAQFPALDHHVPFGLNPNVLLPILQTIGVERLVGLAVSEFQPARDRADQSLSTLMWFLEYVLLEKYESSDEVKARH